MKTKEVILTGESRRELITELRYSTATARVDGTDVVIFLIKKEENDKKTDRRVSSANRILTELKREGLISFFVSPRAFEINSTEAQFFRNKYEYLIDDSDEEYVRIYMNP